MKRVGKIFFAVLTAIFLSNIFAQETNSGVYSDIPDYGKDKYLSPEAITYAGGEKFLICARTGDELIVLNNDKVEKKIPLGGHPSGVAADLGSKTAYITIEAPQGKVLKVDYESGKVLSSYEAGHMPRAPILSADAKFLYFVNQFTGRVAKMDVKSGKIAAEGKAVREPFSQVLSTDGKTLYVLNLIPEAKGGLYEENIGACVSVFDAESLKAIKRIDLPNGSINANQICISPDGAYLYCSSVIARFNVPTTQVERGWINTNAVSVIDAKKNEFVCSFLLDDIDLGASNPFGVVVSPDGKTLVAVQAGTHEISVINLKALHEKIGKALSGELSADRKSPTPTDPANDLAFLFGLRKRIETGALGPRFAAFDADGKNLYVTCYYSDNLVKFHPNEEWKKQEISIGGNPNMNLVRKGDLFFHDGQFCFQKWLSCSTCHTQVRSDALNWDLMNDGIGNPKQSKSMLYAHYTAPCMITGIRKDAETAVRKGLKYIQFVDRPEADAQAIDAYLKSLVEIDSPYLNPDGSMSEAAERGMIIFEEAGCAHCHSGEYYTDMKSHDVGSGLNEYEGKAFDTPTLCEIWRTAPYLYDGRARNIFELFKKFNKSDKHGKTSNLSDDDLRDLEAYVNTL